MLRILRAFAWMRWRVLVNSLERTGARDTLQRLSLAIEQLGPLIAAALFIPTAVTMAALSGYAGHALAASAGGTPLAFKLIRFLLLAAVGLSVAGPIMLPATERTNAVRLLLLPISRVTLYVAQSASGLADPWILLAVPIVLAFPVGVAAGGAFGTAATAVGAGALFLIALVGLSSLATTLLFLLLRDRRRGELLALAFAILLPMVGLFMGLIDDGKGRPRERTAPADPVVPAWARQIGTTAFKLVPSELYRYALVESINPQPPTALQPLLALAALGAALHALGFVAFSRVLGSPASTGSRRTARGISRSRIRLPGLSPGASGVALNQWRLAFRTARGRSILVTPLLVFGMFALLMWRTGDAELGFIELQSGLALATFSAATCVLALMPFAMNQFAIDGAGLTLQLLSPLRDVDIVIGKAVGNGVIAGFAVVLCVMLAVLLFPEGHPGLWLSIPLALTSAYLLAVPAAAAVSAVFPRAVDLNSIGNRSNAHGLAGILGLLAFVGGAMPAALTVVVATRLLGRPALAPAALLVLCGLSLLTCRLLLIPVARLFGRRRENLALVV